MSLHHLRIVKSRFIMHLYATRRERADMERFLTKTSSKRSATNQDQAEPEPVEPQRKKTKRIRTGKRG